MIGIFLTRGFVATYFANAKNDAENHPEVRFQRENEGQNLRNGPEVDRRQQPAPDIAHAKRAAEMFTQSARERTPVPLFTRGVGYAGGNGTPAQGQLLEKPCDPDGDALANKAY